MGSLLPLVAQSFPNTMPIMPHASVQLRRDAIGLGGTRLIGRFSLWANCAGMITEGGPVLADKDSSSRLVEPTSYEGVEIFAVFLVVIIAAAIVASAPISATITASM